MGTSKTKYKILAFDPGLTTTGWSLLEGQIGSGDLTVLKIGEIHPGPTVERVKYKDLVERYDKRTITLEYLREQIDLLMVSLKPDFVCAEDIYLNPHRVQAYGALCMWICAVRMHMRDRYQKYLTAIPTKICKQTCCGSGSGGKLGVQESLLNHKHVHFKNEYDKIHMSEHQADSIAVGMAFADRYQVAIEKELNDGAGKQTS